MLSGATDGLCKPCKRGLWAHLPAGQTVAALGLAVQHLMLLLQAALLLQLLELQVFEELGLRLQGLRFLCRTRLLRGGSLSEAGLISSLLGSTAGRLSVGMG